MTARREITKRFAREYQRADKPEKIRLLDALVETARVASRCVVEFLDTEELNRAPEDTMNTLLMSMSDRVIAVPRSGGWRRCPPSAWSLR